MNEIERQLKEKSKELGQLIHDATKHEMKQIVNDFNKRMKRLYKNVHKDESQLKVVTFKRS